MRSRLVLAVLVGMATACNVRPDSLENEKTSSLVNRDTAQEAALLASAALANNVPATGLAGARGSTQSFTFAVPAGSSNLKFTMSGGTGDADVYVRFGAPPTTSAYDYRPYLDGNNETVTPAASTEGTWYLMVQGYAAYSGVTLVASYQTGGNTGGDVDCTNAATWPSSWTAFEDRVLLLVNQQRAAGASCGGVVKPAVPALTMDAALRRAARCHSLDMAKSNYFSHTGQDGRSPWDRIRNAGYTGFGSAENIAAGQTTPEALMKSWMGSSGHCSNIMSSGSNEIGIGYAYAASSDYDHYWTQDFGKR